MMLKIPCAEHLQIWGLFSQLKISCEKRPLRVSRIYIPDALERV